jgi:hypothetical protein
VSAVPDGPQDLVRRAAVTAPRLAPVAAGEDLGQLRLLSTSTIASAISVSSV